jgi:excisionase family DNA binding protein
MTENKRLVDVKMLSAMISVKCKTLYDWSHKGLVPCVKLGRLLRFDPDEIERWIKSKRQGKAAN